MRTSKTVGTLTSIYFYASGKLLREVRYNSADQTTAVLDFFYAYDGTPYAMKYNGTVYYFVTNLQGDVVMILDANGSLAGGYVYDPYGKVLTATGTIAQINPIRYRGYYHDTETGFYYLQSRYYDPEIGRFINADGYASTGQGVIGHNMFAYCNNNPVNYIDVSGGIPFLATMAIGAAVNVGTSYVAAKVMGQSYSYEDATVAAVCGAASAFGSVGKIAAGIVTGIYTAGTAYEKGSSGVGSLSAGLVAGVTTVVTVPNIVELSSAAAVLCDTTFGIPANVISSATALLFTQESNNTLTLAEYNKLTFKETQLDPPNTTSTISYSRYKKLTFKETQLDPNPKTSTITQAEYDRLTFMERRLS